MTKRYKVPNILKPQRGIDPELQRERRRQQRALTRKSDKSNEQQMAEARRHLEKLYKKRSPELDWANSLIRSVASNQSAVMRSMSIRHPIHAQASTSHWDNKPMAFTDFESIQLTYPVKLIPDRNNRDATMDTITDIRAILQHEIGHLRFTVPFNLLVDKYSGDRLIDYSKDHKSWNILEDQRMETLVVNSVPRIAKYFIVMLGKHILKESDGLSWILVAGREYVPKAIRVKSASEFNSTVSRNTAAREWFDIVNSYKSATSVDAMMQAVFDASDFLSTIQFQGEGGTTHRNPWREPGQKGTPEEACEPREYDGDDDQEGESGQGGSDSTNDKDSGDKSDSGSGDASNDGDDEKPISSVNAQDRNSLSSGQSADTDSNDSNHDHGKSEQRSTSTQSNNYEVSINRSHSVSDQLKDMAEQLSLQNRDDQDNQSILSMANASADNKGMSDVPQAGAPMSEDEEQQAYTVMVGIQNALSDFETASQPGWVSRQESGIIDALAYRTKQVGSLDYHRRLEGDFNSGVDLHVSMLCDISGSMDGEPMRHLSIALYGTALACRNLGIGASFTLWSTPGNEGRVWRDGDITPTLWGAAGGTNPMDALDDLDNHNEEDASNHLVLIFTDGAWDSSIPPLTMWSRPGRHIVLCELGTGYFYGNNDHHADHYVKIKDVMELPEQLSMAISNMLS